MTNARTPRIAIIGSGFSGLGLAIRLNKAGIDSFEILEKAPRLGGTWRENTYPGAECDIASPLYSYSFERNPRWSHKWSHQPEILEYLDHCARKYDVERHIRFDTEVARASFRESDGNWEVELAGGDVEIFDAVVAATGQLHQTHTPEIPGAENFECESFHSAHWNHDVDLEGRHVSVIGNAASAIQFIPQIAKTAKSVTVFQRTPNWIVPKNDKEFSEFQKQLGAALPLVTKLSRVSLWLRGELMLYPLMHKRAFTRARAQQAAIDYMQEKITDPELRKKLIPDYPMGAKRILFSDDYYDALARDNVSVVTEPIVAIDADGVVTESGTHHTAEVLIYATGFKTASFFSPIRIEGRDGRALNDLWKERGAEAYLGITHTGFPNFFMMYGPNTNLGHNSIVVMAECQIRYILDCIKLLGSQKVNWVDVKPEVQARYNTWIERRMQKKVWSEVEKSWYQSAGRVTNNWVGSTQEYWWRTRHFDLGNYEISLEA